MKRNSWILASILGLCSLLAASTYADETVWVSSLDLSKARQGWGKAQVDKSVDAHPITLKGQKFEHGFGTHPPGLLMIDLKGGAKQFSATVGIDDEVAPGKGSAEFQVIDSKGTILWRSGVMHSGDTPKPVSLEVTGYTQIGLRVTTGGDGYEFDHTDWADAKFIVAGEKPEATVWSSRELAISMTHESPKPEIHEPAVVGIRPGTPFLWTVPVTGDRPMTYSTKGLPKGLAIDPKTGTITGQVEKPGDYRVRIQVRNSAGKADGTIRIVAGSTIALTPPMGWNSYDCFGDNVVESEVLANAKYVAENMQPVGWDTIVVDYCWYDPGAHDNDRNKRAGAELTMDAYGRLLPAVNRFPSAKDGAGFKPLSDAVHGMGLKFGIHIMRGIPRNAVLKNLPIEGRHFKAADAANTNSTCVWCPDMFGVRGATDAGQAYYDSIFRLYASWGVDYVKMDDTSSPYSTEEIEAVRKAIDKCGRSMVFSLSPGETPIDQGAHVSRYTNLWRVSGDFWDEWTPLDNEFTLGARWIPYVGAGHWPDADMLPVGHLSVNGRCVGGDRQTRFTRNELVTLMSLWSLLPSPLMVGANLPDNDPWTLALLTNPEVLAINQDSLAAAGHRVSQDEFVQVWARKLSDGSMAVGLFNRDDLEHSATLDWSQLGIKGSQRVRNVWTRQDLGLFSGKYEASVPGHGAILIRLKQSMKMH